MGVPATEHEHSSPTATGLGRQTSERRVGKYRILSELGRGGTATVYLAVARGQGGVSKLVVLKALLPEFAGDPGALSMFMDEARLAAQLNHANVVQTYEIGSEGERSVIVMEYLEGQSLSRIARYAERAGEPLLDTMQLRILVNVLEGLHYAHELRGYDGMSLFLVHRDVSPQNVFVTYDGQVKVLDFGIAKVSTSSTQSGAGLIKGKLAYMAPEQMLGEAVDRRADVFSVGCMLWAIAATRKLWKDVPDVHIVRRVTRGEIPSPKSVNPACPGELERITMKALAFNPDERYASALDMQEDLEQFLTRLGPPVTQRELGRYVSHLFASARAELRETIEHQLASLALEDTVVSAEYPIIEHRVDSDASHLRPVEEPGKQRRRRIALAAGLAALGVAAALLWPRGEATAPPRIEVATTVPASLPVADVLAAQPASEGVAGPKTTTVHWGTVAPGSSVFLDGRKLPPGSSAEPLPLDGQVHRLRVETPGRAPIEREFFLPQAGDLQLSLEKGAARPAKAPAARPRAAAPAPAPAPVPPDPAPTSADAAKRTCDNPFFLDANGIKRMRPECL